MILLLAALPMSDGTHIAAAADVNKGAQIYAIHCANCHGGAGIPVMLPAPNFQRGEKLLQADMMLLASIRRGKNVMPAYAGMLRDNEIMDVISYLRMLQR